MEASTPPAPRETSSLGLMVCTAAIVLLVIGSIGTWVKVGPVTGDGLSRDGKITLILAIIAGLFLVIAAARGRHISRVGIGITAVLALATCIYDVQDVSSADVLGQSASVGWGLWMCLVGSFVLAVGTVVARR
jgi:hypothetical protein